MENESVYEQNGYKNRRDYLNCLCEDYNAPKEVVYSLAQLLGPIEDFDGLINALEDYSQEL